VRVFTLGGVIGDEGETRAWQRLLDQVVAARECLAALEFETVQVVREAGATWEEIGEALGMSRQAARQRFGQPRPGRRQ
jgi:hypothetical protein